MVKTSSYTKGRHLAWLKRQNEELRRKLEQAVAREQQLADTEALTGLNNHRSLMELATQLFDVAMRYRHPFSVVLFGIDNLNEINDSYGTAVGERILEQVEHVAGAGLRSADSVGRCGVDTLVIVMPMTTALQAFAVAERIRAAVAAFRVTTPAGDAAAVISVGIAELFHPSRDATVERIIARADEARCAAKKSGGNRTVLSSATHCNPTLSSKESSPTAHSAETLRYMAEARLHERAAAPADVAAEAIDLPNELRLYQIELEMQNEELRWAQEELEASQSRYFYLYELAPVGFFTLSEQGLILEANLTAATLLGVARGALIRQPLTRFILPEDQGSYSLHRKQLLATTTPQVCELRMIKRDGTRFLARLEATTSQNINGVQEYRALLSDITKHKPAG